MKKFITFTKAQVTFLVHMFKDNVSPKTPGKKALIYATCALILPIQIVWTLSLSTIAMFSKKVENVMEAIMTANANYYRS